MDQIIKRICSEKYLKEIYRKLKEEDLLCKYYCVPFLPYVGRNYWNVKTRILYVGRAPYGWGELKERDKDGKKEYKWETIPLTKPSYMNPEKLAELSKKFVENCLKPYYDEDLKGEEGKRFRDDRWSRGRIYNSLFWQRIYVLTISIYEGEFIGYSYNTYDGNFECFQSIAWTNVFKIGMVEGNPDSKMIKFLLKNFNTLREEIEYLKPDLIIFSTGKSYDKYLREALEIETPDDIEETEGVKRLGDVYNSALVLRTKHFQAIRNEELEKIYNYIKRELDIESRE